jgi:Tol biopolymer transport system component/DNA-binding winged helix-turn-helix (wHTH) protein
VVVTFAEYRLDLTSGELWNGSDRVFVPDQPFRILSILIAHRGRLVTRDELRRAVWADHTFVDFEHGLNAAVKRLREILGDSASTPRFIETIPRRGYRFIAEVRDEAAAVVDAMSNQGETAATAVTGPAAQRPHARLQWTTAIVCVVIAGAGSALAWRSFRSSNPDRFSGGRLVRVTTSSGLNIDPALSPDGALVAYASDRAGANNFDIWVQPIAGGNAARITSDAGDEIEPSFSPDGTSIVFAKAETGGIYIIGTLGGEPRQVVAANRAHMPHFSPDGRSVVYWTGQTVWTFRGLTRPPSVTAAVSVVPSGSGSPRSVTQGFLSARYAIWSPDGRRILFLGEREKGGSSTQDWYVVDPDGAQPVQTGAIDVIERAGVTGVPIPGEWTRDGDVVFTTAKDDHANVWRVAVSPDTGRVGGAPRRLTFGSAVERTPVLSGSRLAFASIAENVDIWRVPLDPATGLAAGALERVTDDAAADFLRNVSADGRLVAFTSSRTNPEQVWVKDISSGPERQLTRLDTPATGAQISPDGSRVAVSTSVAGRSRVDVYPSSGGSPSMLCDDCGLGGWSPDGSRMLIGRATERRVIDVATLREQGLARRPNWNLNVPRFSPDGRWASFHTTNAPDLRQIFAIPASVGAPVPSDKWIPVVTDFGIQPSWARDGGGVYHFSIRDGHFCPWLQLVDPATKRPVGLPGAVIHLHDPRLRAAVRAMPTNDVQGGYLYMTLTEATGNIWMLDAAAPSASHDDR